MFLRAPVPESLLPHHNEWDHDNHASKFLRDAAMGAATVATLFYAFYAYYHIKTLSTKKALLSGTADIYIWLYTLTFTIAGDNKSDLHGKIQEIRDAFDDDILDPEEILPYWSSPSSPASDPGDVCIFVSDEMPVPSEDNV
jgi:hypothetical protein